MTVLVAFAGESRSGKGTCAAVFREEAAAMGLTSLERQLSDNGKWAAARAFMPWVCRVDAVQFWEDMKRVQSGTVMIGKGNEMMGLDPVTSRPIQQFLQNSLQEGHRDIFGEDFWTDMLLERGAMDLGRISEIEGCSRPAWHRTFFDNEAGVDPTDLAIISDLRQPNEACRVKEVKGVVIECVRPEVEDQYRTGSGHVTERRLPPELVDYTINNVTDVGGLEGAARQLFHERFKKMVG